MGAQQEYQQSVSDLLMRHIVPMLGLAAGSEAQRGGRFLIRLSGDLNGSWALSLNPGAVAVDPAKDDSGFDGTVDWSVSFGDVSDILEGTYRFDAARKEKRLAIDADKTNGVRLNRALDAMARIRLQAWLQDVPRGLMTQFVDEAGLLDESKKEKKATTGVQLTKNRSHSR